MTAIQYFWRHPLAEQVREEGREEGRKEGRKEGRVQAWRETILSVLGRRGIPVPQAVRERVNACADLGQLEVWLRRALHATNATDLFADELSQANRRGTAAQ
ncbi:hypothetical protein ACWEKM_17825 [Streptomyces sp. NPDC004752]